MAEYLKREQAAVFKKYRITFPQYNVLRVLDASVRGQNSLSNVSRIMLVAVSNLSGLVKRLEKKGFIVRRKDPKDGRVTIMEITERGRRTLRDCEEDKERDLRKIRAHMPDRDKRLILGMIKQALRRDR